VSTQPKRSSFLTVWITLMALKIPSSGGQSPSNSTKIKFSNSKITKFLLLNARPINHSTKTATSALHVHLAKFSTSAQSNAQTAKVKKSTFKRPTNASKSTKSQITTQVKTGLQQMETANPSTTNSVICKIKITQSSSALLTDHSPTNT
jgi:hypothetical protein